MSSSLLAYPIRRLPRNNNCYRVHKGKHGVDEGRARAFAPAFRPRHRIPAHPAVAFPMLGKFGRVSSKDRQFEDGPRPSPLVPRPWPLSSPTLRVDVRRGNGYSVRRMSWLLHNPTFWSAFLAWMAAQAIKLLTHLAQTGKLDFSYFVSTGGMPSAHSAMVSGLTTSVAVREGTDGAVFAVTLAFALVVMFDAQSVRRAAGQQARLLNQIVEQLVRTHHVPRQKLAELLGHTRMEVAAGMLLGICVCFLVHAFAGTLA